jgi:hypothetical protein
MTEDEVPLLAKRLGGSGKPDETGYFRADCPVPRHFNVGAPNGSLRLRWWPDSGLGVYCSAGCTTKQIERAVRLKYFPKPPAKLSKREIERRALFEEQRKACSLNSTWPIDSAGNSWLEDNGLRVVIVEEDGLWRAILANIATGFIYSPKQRFKTKENLKKALFEALPRIKSHLGIVERKTKRELPVFPPPPPPRVDTRQVGWRAIDWASVPGILTGAESHAWSLAVRAENERLKAEHEERLKMVDDLGDEGAKKPSPGGDGSI